MKRKIEQEKKLENEINENKNNFILYKNLNKIK